MFGAHCMFATLIWCECWTDLYGVIGWSFALFRLLLSVSDYLRHVCFTPRLPVFSLPCLLIDHVGWKFLDDLDWKDEKECWLRLIDPWCVVLMDLGWLLWLEFVSVVNHHLHHFVLRFLEMHSFSKCKQSDGMNAVNHLMIAKCFECICQSQAQIKRDCS